MFGRLKDKLSGFINKFSKKVEEEVEEEAKTRPEAEGKPEAVAEHVAEEAEEIVEPGPLEEEEKVVEPEAPEPEKPEEVEPEPAPEPEEPEAAKPKKKPKAKPKRPKEVLKPEPEPAPGPAPEPEGPEEVGPTPEPEAPEPEPERVEPELLKEIKPVPKPEPERVEPEPEKRGFLGKIFGGKREVPAAEPMPAAAQGFLGKITSKTIEDKDIETLMWEFQLGLLENDVAYDTAQKICGDIKANLVGKPVRRGQVDTAIKNAITFAIRDVLKEGYDLIEKIKKSKKPFKIIFVGVNGTGKTTSIAKVAHLCKQNGLEPVLAAGDTFRAASIEQLEHHARVLDVRMVKHDYGSDSTAVAFDAVEHAKATGKDVVLVDTAGRMHSNLNLMDELGKMLRVIEPDLVLFVGDAMTGNDAAEQAKRFAALRVDAAILTKADADAKGGACISISHAIQRPILYLGTGQSYNDLTRFTPDWFVEKIIA